MVSQQLRVFIGSTSVDLQQYRQTAIEICIELGLLPIAMEFFEAMEEGATNGSIMQVVKADVYVGIFAFRYGYIEAGYNKSVTEIEYDYAGKEGLERLCFLARPDHPGWAYDHLDIQNASLLKIFRDKVGNEKIVKFFTSSDDFGRQLATTLSNWKERNTLVQIEIIIEDVDDFNEEHFRDVIGQITETPRSEVRIIVKKQNSISLRLEVSEYTAKRIVDLFENNPEVFGDYEVRSVRYVPSPLESQDTSKLNRTSSKLPAESEQEQGIKTSMANTKQVFVVYGRNIALKRSFSLFMQSIGLKILEWEEVLTQSGQANPSILTIMDLVFTQAQAIVVLLTPDDEGRLKQEFHHSNDNSYETTFSGQPRQNVIFEAGIAIGRYPERTILVQIGEIRLFSDLSGRYIIRLENSVIARRQLAEALKNVGCEVNLNGVDWHHAGDFTVN